MDRTSELCDGLSPYQLETKVEEVTMPIISPEQETTSSRTFGILRGMTPSDSDLWDFFPPKEAPKDDEAKTKGLTAYWRDIRRETSFREVKRSLPVKKVDGIICVPDE